MANPTTNFGWVMPTSSSLVTNLPADFNTFGQAVDTSMSELLGGTTGQVLSKTSNTNMDFTWVTPQVGDITGVTAGTGISGGGTSGDVTVTNSMATAITTNGDLIYGTGSGTFTRRGIGTTGQVLSVVAGVPNWATPAGGLTLIARTTFSGVATQVFDSVFTSTYKSYLVVFENLSAVTSSDKLHLQFRYSSTTQAAGYYGNNIYAGSNSATVTNDFTNNVTFQIIAQGCGSSSNPGSGFMYVSNVGTGSQTANANGMYNSNQQGNGGSFNCASTTARSYDGFLLKSASTNISGTVAIYGMAAA